MEWICGVIAVFIVLAVVMNIVIGKMYHNNDNR